MRIESKNSRMFRLAPLAAGLATIVMVAACARTNGRTPISEESAEKLVTMSKKTVWNYDESAPQNMEFAKTLKGASLTVNTRDAATNALDATVKIVFADDTPDIVAQGTMTGKTKDVDGTLLTSGKLGDRITMLSHCLNASCQVVVVEIDKNEVPAAQPVAAAAPTAAAPAAAAPAADAGAVVKGGLTAQAAEVKPADAATAAAAPATATQASATAAAPATTAAPAATADAAASQAPAQTATTGAATAAPVATDATAPVTVAKAVIIFTVDSITKRAKVKKADKDADSSDDSAPTTISNTFVIRYSTPTEAGKKSGDLVPYETAYQSKYQKPAPTDAELAATAIANANVCAKDDKGVVTCNVPAPATQVGAGSTSPAAPAATAAAAPAAAAPAATVPAKTK